MKRAEGLCRWLGHRWKVTQWWHPAEGVWSKPIHYCGRCFAEKGASDG